MAGPAAAGGGGRAWVVVGLGLAVFVVLLGVGFDVVATPVGSLHDLTTAGGGRQEMLRDMAVEFRQFPLLGTGLGTHEFVFGLFDRRDLPSLATHAENEYAQLLEETGVAGVALAGLFLAGLAVSYVRATRRPVDPIDYVPFGLGFGLVAILVHSGTDFGQHIPADAALTATFAALLTGLARHRPGVDGAGGVGGVDAAAPARRPWSLPLAGGVAAWRRWPAAVAVGLWADRARAAESHWADAQAAGGRPGGPGLAGDRRGLRRPAGPGGGGRRGRAGRRRLPVPDGHVPVQGPVAHGRPQTGRTCSPPAGCRRRRRSWPTWTPPGCCARRTARRCAWPGRSTGTSWAGRPGARPRSPPPTAWPRTTGPICLIAGLDAVDGTRTGAGRRDPGPVPEAGRVAARLRRLLPRPGRTAGARTGCCSRPHGPDVPGRRMPAGDPRWQAWIAKCRSVAADELAADAAKPDATPVTLAERAEAIADQGQSAEAAALFERALAEEYGNVDWRLRRARCLLDAGRPAEAAAEARLCLQLRPGMADASTLASECDARAATRP